MTPLFRPLACKPHSRSFSISATFYLPNRDFNSRAMLSPTTPPPTTKKSAVTIRKFTQIYFESHALRGGFFEEHLRCLYGGFYLEGAFRHDFQENTPMTTAKVRNSEKMSDGEKTELSGSRLRLKSLSSHVKLAPTKSQSTRAIIGKTSLFQFRWFSH